MIFDLLDNISYYCRLNEHFYKACNFVMRENLGMLQHGKHQILTDKIFAVVSEYDTKDYQFDLWEIHKRYADLQIVLEGFEVIAYSPIGYLKEKEPYNCDKDFALFVGDPAEKVFLHLDKVNFCIFFPGEPHIPGLTKKQTTKVRKLVVKIAMI